MADFNLPNLGENINEADVLKVLVAEGDVITRDQPLLEIETEKATLDVPSEVAGRVTKIHVAAGQVIKPGQLVISFEAADASPSAPVVAAPAQVEASPPAAPEPRDTAAPAAPAPAAPPIPVAPAPPRLPTPIARTAPAPAPASAPVAAAAAATDMPIFAPPGVRNLGRELGVDLRAVRGTGPNGRITEDDVRRSAEGARGAEPSTSHGALARASATPLPQFEQWGEIEREPLSRLRRTVVRNMAQSWAEIPHAHLYAHADITKMEEMRQRYKARAQAAGGNLTISVMMLKVVAAALRAHPRLNASLDTDANELVLKRYINIGVAVDTERGLVVPKIEHVDQKSVLELAVELNAIAERARGNQLTLEEQRGATFTVTNLGSLGTGYFDPIINWPEVAILGLGRAEQVPVWLDGRWQPQLRMPMSLAIDHRVIDGADGARFMSWIADAIDNPFMMMLEG